MTQTTRAKTMKTADAESVSRPLASNEDAGFGEARARSATAAKLAALSARNAAQKGGAKAPAAKVAVIASVSSPESVAEPEAPSVDPSLAKAASPPRAAAPASKPSGGFKASGFKLNEFIVYPAHGVGQIVDIEEKEIAGFKLEVFVVNFVKDKMILRVPTAKATSFGMRKLADAALMKKAMDLLTGKARVKRTMWSRRAQEYEAKINSGDLIAITEVVRDLYRSDAQPEQSYSERQLYEAALDRVARELAAVQAMSESEALKLIDAQLQKGPRRPSKAEADAEAAAEGEAQGSGDFDEAA